MTTSQGRPATAAGDALLVARSRDCPEVFGELFDRHAAGIHRYLARRVGYAVADDLVAETFLIAFEGRHRYDSRYDDARPWLYGIASNLLRRHHRAEARHLRALARLGAEPDRSSEEPPTDALIARVDAAAALPALADALVGLPAGEREVLLLRAWAGLGYAEIALALRLSVPTVRTRMHRARARLRSALRSEGMPDDE